MHRKRPLAWIALASLAFLACTGPSPRGTEGDMESVRERQCLDHADVCLETVRRGEHTRFRASNGEAAPYTFRVRVEHLVNLRPLAPPPFQAVVGPGEEAVIGALAPIREGRPARFASEWAAALGSMHARHDPRWHYRMPFGGDEPQVVSQGIDGPTTTHSGPARYSFDFSMPSGTPVLAARAGRVVSVVDGDDAHGMRDLPYDRANRVRVLHADGTIAVYAHLRHGVAVSLGDAVATGQLIGYSGDTGFTTGPHLHFMVWRRLPSLGWTSVPVRFHDGTERGFVPGTGVAYAPACAATGVGCADGEGPPPSESVPAAPAQ